MPTTTVPGPVGTLHIDDGGTGVPPLVFLHAFAGSGEHRRAQLDHFQKSRRAIAIDFRNHGRSGRTELLDDLTVDRLAGIFGTSHWAQMDKPDEINAIIEAFVENEVRADLDRRYARAAE